MTLWDHATPLVWGVAITAALVGAVTDAVSRRIPNLLTFPVLLGGFVWATWVGGLAGLADAVAGCLLLAFPYLLLLAFGGGGAGDAKLMGAIGAWLGVLNGVVVLLAVTLAGGILAIGFALAKGRLRSALGNLGGLATYLSFLAFGRRGLAGPIPDLPTTKDMQKIPYGIGIFVGVSIAAGGILLWRA